MASPEIFAFTISGDRHLDKALQVALAPEFGEKPVEIWGYREDREKERLFLYQKPYHYREEIIPLPAPIADPLDLIVSWLRKQEWSTSGQYSDVVYRRGYKLTNTIYDSYDIDLVFTVEPHWTEYHK